MTGLPQCDRCTPLGKDHHQRPDEAAVWVPDRREWLCEHCRDEHAVTPIPTDDGLHLGITDINYHADTESLSSSGARTLLIAPAKFDYERLNPPKPKQEYDFGHVAHKLVLGEGADIVVVPFETWNTNKAKAMRDEAYAQHKIPIKPSQLAIAKQMAAAVLAHPLAAKLLEATGYSELSGYWRDPLTGVRLRYRPDRLAELPGRIVCVDYKTTTDASPAHFGKASSDFGYFQQDPWYRDGLIANDVTDNPGFVFIAQEKKPPFLVSVLQHEPDDIQRGRELNRAAIDIYARCTETGVWPGYGNGIHTIHMPGWHASQHEARLEALTRLTDIAA
uniref:RecE-like exonuclease n=1 Tax=Mycobacterium phage Farewell TaxID=3158893 RepID=A0AAU8GM12_9CAUD